MSTVAVGTVESLTDETPPVFKDLAGSREIVQGCWAWVAFNGAGTLAVQDSFNTSSVTDNGTGSYTAEFDTALPNTNYAAVAQANDGAILLQSYHFPGGSPRSTSQLGLTSYYVANTAGGGTPQDADLYTCAVFANP